MATEGVKASIAKLEKSILEDGKVDRAEAQILLVFAKPRTADNAEMAEFVKLLESVLEDGAVTTVAPVSALARVGQMALRS